MNGADIAQLLGAGGALLFGGGGIVALLRARSQNKTDAQSLLNASQSEFRTAILARLTEVETDRDQVLIDNAAMQVKIAVMANQIDDVTALMLERDVARKERDAALKRLEECDRKADLDRQRNAKRISHLETQVADLTRQLDELTKHKDGAE